LRCAAHEIVSRFAGAATHAPLLSRTCNRIWFFIARQALSATLKNLGFEPFLRRCAFSEKPY